MKRMHKNAKRSAATPSAVVSLALLTHSELAPIENFLQKKDTVHPEIAPFVIIWRKLTKMKPFVGMKVGRAALVLGGLSAPVARLDL